MTKSEYCQRLHEVTFTAGMNQRYHQKVESYYAWADRWNRIAVGIMAVLGLVAALPEVAHQAVGLWLAVASLVVATILNIVPVGEWAMAHGKLFRLWNDLRKEAIAESLKVCQLPGDGPIPDHMPGRLADLIAEMETLNGEESTANRKILQECEADELEAEWGEGIRTAEAAERERVKRIKAAEVASGAEVGPPA